MTNKGSARWARPRAFRLLGAQLIAQLAAQLPPLYPIWISIPEDQVVAEVPLKSREFAPWKGTSRGGRFDEYTFPPTDAGERAYRRMYQRSRYAETQKKNGWDAYRHVEILANGAVPSFPALDDAPALAVPHLPRAALRAARTSRDYNRTVVA